MKYLTQTFSNGKINIEESPIPNYSENDVLIRTELSLISPGTERMLINFGKSSFIKKIASQPDKVKQVIRKIKTDGVGATFKSVSGKLSSPTPLGYSNYGEVIAVGKNASNFKIGDKVVSNGNHSEYVSVNKNLCVKVNNIPPKLAVFAILAAIPLQGIRLSNVEIGSKVIVIGVGIVGLLLIQLLKSNGCNVIAVDYDDDKLKIAKKYGATIFSLKDENSLHKYAESITEGNGLDAAFICASTKNNLPIRLSEKILRKRGEIILIGISGLNLSRDAFYKKEISFKVSCSYGPGRYDDNYEKFGCDYPYPYVRWTENRNLQTIIELMKNKAITSDLLIDRKFKFAEFDLAYKYLLNNQCLGILFTYSNKKININKKIVYSTSKFDNKKPVIGLIGAGNFMSSNIIQSIKKNKNYIKSINSYYGISSSSLAKNNSIDNAVRESNDIFHDRSITHVFISTRHNSHANLLLEGLKSKKTIYLDKPLCLNLTELTRIDKYLEKNKDCSFTVGFNRRFSKLSQKVKELLLPLKVPKTYIYNINAGHIESTHWTQNKDIGGGRLVGEVCHFIDLIRFFNGYKIVSYDINLMDSLTSDTFSINLKFEDNSIAQINYFSNGNKNLPKEKIEIYADNKNLILENFKKLKGYGWSNFNSMRLWNQDKGIDNMISIFLSNKKDLIIPYEEILEISKITIDLQQKINK